MMATHYLILSFLFLAPVPKTSDEELKKIQGQWQVTHSAWQGDLYPHTPNGPGSQIVVVDKDRLTVQSKNGKFQFRISRIAAGEIDLVRESPPVVGDTLAGIYSIDGDTLKLCFAWYGPKSTDNPPKRPTEFKAPEDSDHIAYITKRKKTE